MEPSELQSAGTFHIPLLVMAIYRKLTLARRLHRLPSMRRATLGAILILCSGFLLQGGDHDCPEYPNSRWSFNPDTLDQKADYQELMTTRLGESIPHSDLTGSPPRQNFIDDHIFGRLEAENVQPASLASDEEFMRRVTIDLTGRPPDYERLRLFLSDQSTTKKERLIDELLDSEAFVDRWTFWMGEMIRNTMAYPTITVEGRNALHFYLRDSIQNRKPYNTIVSELIQGSGNSRTYGPANFVLRNYSTADPIHDTWDDYTANVMSRSLWQCQNGTRLLTRRGLHSRLACGPAHRLRAATLRDF